MFGSLRVRLHPLLLCLISVLGAVLAPGAVRYDSVHRTLFYSSDATEKDSRLFLAVSMDAEGRPVSLMLGPDARTEKDGFRFFNGIQIAIEPGKMTVAGMKKFDELTLVFTTGAQQEKVSDTLLSERNGLLVFSPNGLTSERGFLWLSTATMVPALKAIFAESVALKAKSGPLVRFENVLTVEYSPQKPLPQIAMADSVEMTLPPLAGNPSHERPQPEAF